MPALVLSSCETKMEADVRIKLTVLGLEHPARLSGSAVKWNPWGESNSPHSGFVDQMPKAIGRGVLVPRRGFDPLSPI